MKRSKLCVVSILLCVILVIPSVTSKAYYLELGSSTHNYASYEGWDFKLKSTVYYSSLTSNHLSITGMDSYAWNYSDSDSAICNPTFRVDGKINGTTIYHNSLYYYSNTILQPGNSQYTFINWPSFVSNKYGTGTTYDVSNSGSTILQTTLGICSGESAQNHLYDWYYTGSWRGTGQVNVLDEVSLNGSSYTLWATTGTTGSENELESTGVNISLSNEMDEIILSVEEDQKVIFSNAPKVYGSQNGKIEECEIANSIDYSGNQAIIPVECLDGYDNIVVEIPGMNRVQQVQESLICSISAESELFYDEDSGKKVLVLSYNPEEAGIMMHEAQIMGNSNAKEFMTQILFDEDGNPTKGSLYYFVADEFIPSETYCFIVSEILEPLSVESGSIKLEL